MPARGSRWLLVTAFRGTQAAALSVSVAVGAVAALPGAAGAGTATGQVRGEVISRATGRPVRGAVITLPDRGLVARSRADGTFSMARPIPVAAPYSRIGAVVNAPGYGRWTISGAPLYPGDALELHVELRRAPFRHSVLSPAERAAGGAGPAIPSSTYSSTCSGWDEQLVPPQNIWVFVTSDGSNQAKLYDFAFYLSHVLPNEWIASWDSDALQAGAIAAKTYAWYRTGSGNAYSGGSGCADVIDTTADQVFDPTWSAASTDQAVYATLGSVLFQDGAIFLSQYWSGAKGDPCAPVTSGQYAGRMSQWGTETCATGDPPMVWNDIVGTYYGAEATTTWHYLNQLVLNRSFESGPGMYAWPVNSGTVLTRVKDGASGGDWYVALDTTKANDDAVLRQDGPYDGTPSSSFTVSFSAFCSKDNAGKCKFTAKLYGMPDSGSSGVTSYTVSQIARNGKWATYTFAATPGIDFTSFKVKFISRQVVGLDMIGLTAVTP